MTTHSPHVATHAYRSTTILHGLFATTPGLLLLVTAWEALIVAFMSIFSATGPLAALDLPARLGLELDAADRVGRIIMLYHALAVPFVAALVYLILDRLPLGDRYPRAIRPAITAGYMLTSVGGLGFGYFGAGWIAHGVFLVGLSLAFYAGVVLWLGLWPWRGGFSLERLSFWLVALYTLLSAIIGAAAGAYFGNGFEAFLAEDIVRMEHDLGQRAIIAHLHIMLTLIDVALLLLIAHIVGLRGRAQRLVLWLIIGGTTVVSLATWSVMIIEEIAHKIINVGAALLLPGAVLVAIYGTAGLIRERLGAQGVTEATPGQRLRALLADPVRLGVLFELIFVNLVVTIPGVYVAFQLETYRQAAYLEVERTILVGHWHVLATLSAVVALFLVIDRLGARGLIRQVVGWGVLAGSTLAFVAVQFYMFRRPGEVLAWPVPLLDAGIGLFLIALALFLGVQLAHLIAPRGRWQEIKTTIKDESAHTQAHRSSE